VSTASAAVWPADADDVHAVSIAEPGSQSHRPLAGQHERPFDITLSTEVLFLASWASGARTDGEDR
jgi:hypothetical protein